MSRLWRPVICQGSKPGRFTRTSRRRRHLKKPRCTTCYDGLVRSPARARAHRSDASEDSGDVSSDRRAHQSSSGGASAQTRCDRRSVGFSPGQILRVQSGLRLRLRRDTPVVANHKSAVKAHRQNVKARARNRQLRTRMRGALRSVRSAIDSGDAGQAKETLRTTVSLIDKLVGKGVIHANAAARHKSRLTRRLARVSASA